MWFILGEFGCIDGLYGWNVNKKGLEGEAEKGEEASSRDCTG